MADDVSPYVGLKNQGCTNTLNVFVQSLYHLPSFRQLIYDLPRQQKEGGDEKTPVVKALQRLFYRLDYSQEKAVDAHELIAALKMNPYLTHDHTEFWRCLLDTLETESKFSQGEEGAQGEKNFLEELFRGSMVTFLKCLHVDEESCREEYFMLLDLVVENSDSIETSLEKFIEKERLEGDNQYRTKEHGEQDADRFVLLKTLPPVLAFSLGRFVLDFELLVMKKVCDYLKIPDEIDLSPFLCPEVELGSTRFHLYSIHVHAGSVNGGHSFLILQPFPHTTRDVASPWFTFDDSLVSRCPKENLQNYFGGNGNHSSAFFVIFIREDFVEKNNFEPHAPSWLVEEMAKENLVGRARNVKGVKKQP